jgi:hypothetical protein
MVAIFVLMNFYADGKKAPMTPKYFPKRGHELFHLKFCQCVTL